MCVCMPHKRRSEGNFWESVFSLHRLGPGNQTQVIRPGDKHLYLLRHLAGPLNKHNYKNMLPYLYKIILEINIVTHNFYLGQFFLIWGNRIK